MILVDTNVWREASHPQGDGAVRAWLLAQEPKLRLSTIVLAEMRFGLAAMTDGRRKKALEFWCDRLEAEYADRMVSFDAACTRPYGALAAAMRQKGQNTGVADLQLAAQALAHNLSFATRNTGHFEPTGVKLINPWEF